MIKMQSQIHLNVECEPEYQIENMEEFVKNFNSLLKVEIANWIGKGNSILHKNIQVLTNVQNLPTPQKATPDNKVESEKNS